MNNLGKRPPKKTLIHALKIYEILEIARAHNVNKSTVKNWIKKYEIDIEKIKKI